MGTHLVIPDTHAKPNDDFRRFEWVGNAIVDLRPDVVVYLGDFGDFESLSSYDKGKLSFEGKRLQEDIQSVRHALSLTTSPLIQHNLMLAKNRKKQYKPRIIMLGGNHDDDRLKRLVNNTPELAGLVGVDSIGYNSYGMEYFEYQVPVVVDDIAYCHNFASGVMGKPIGGVNLARSLVKRNHMSSTVGHAHVFDYAVEARADGRKLHGLSAGCLLGGYVPSYAKNSAKFWWEGIVLKTNVNMGDYTLKQISQDELRSSYGQG